MCDKYLNKGKFTLFQTSNMSEILLHYSQLSKKDSIFLPFTLTKVFVFPRGKAKKIEK